jgi:hypothetical protein
MLDVYSPIALMEGARVYGFGSFNDISIVGLGGCVASSEIVSGQMIYTVKVSFNLPDRRSETRSLLHDLSFYPFALRIMDIYGDTYLVGTNQKPHPMMSHTYYNESTPTGKRIFQLEVTYVNIFSLLQLQ